MKKRNLILNLSIVIIALLGLTLSSCGGGKGKGDKPSPSGSTVSLDVTSVSINVGASQSVKVTASANWTATPSSKDVTVSPSSGAKGTTQVAISLSSSASQDSYTVTFKCGSSSSTVTVKKSGGGGGTGTITINPTELSIPAAAGNGTVNLTCSGSWTINVNNKPDWVTKVSPTSGTGNQTITITTTANTERVSKTYIMTVSSGTNTASIIVAKEAAPNSAPTKPSNLAPKGSNVDRFPNFTWTASTDANNDQIKYTVQYSTDNTNWKTVETTEKTSLLPKSSFAENTTYYWKVIANDGYEGGRTESDVVSFTTGTAKKYYDDCEVSVYQTGTVANPVVLTFTGDGYTQELHEYGGQFDTEMNAGIEAFFAIEPYKTYRHYFTIYKIAAYSNEAGMSSGSTDWTEATNKVDTRFRCSWEGGSSTGIGCDAGLVVDVISKVPPFKGLTGQALYNKLSYSPTSILINTNQYAGTNIFYRGLGGYTIGGFGILSIAQTPARHPKGSGYGDSWNTLRHEFGGHGFGLLADEYVYYSSQTIPDSDKSRRQTWKSYGLIGCYGNVTFTNVEEDCEWAQFIGRPEYADAHIGLYEGALMYGLGVWRPEVASCMIDNRPHFNTQSRWQIYRRIKLTAQETPTLEDFIANDNDKVQSFTQAPQTKSSGYRMPYPPIMYDEFGRRVK